MDRVVRPRSAVHDDLSGVDVHSYALRGRPFRPRERRQLRLEFCVVTEVQVGTVLERTGPDGLDDGEELLPGLHRMNRVLAARAAITRSNADS